MDWVTSIHQAIQYIEEHLREELTIREIAQQAALSPFYFQKGFAMLCGMTVGDYIRQRRLSAAGLEVLTTDRKIIDIALDFGYDSPDSFTKAFTRFHGLTPAALRKSGGAVRSFAPLRIKVTLEGGQNMDCKIMKKEAFTVLCRAKTFKYEDAVAQVPQFWAEHFGTGGGKVVCGMYGINLDESMGGNEFEYLIADNYDPAREIPDGFTTRTIPAHTWAVFPCTGRMPQALQGLNQQIFSQWLPTNPDYKIAAGINVAAPGLLRGDIVHRAQGLLGQGGLGGGGEPGDAEVGHLQAAVPQDHHIVGLDVPVDDALLVGALQGHEDLGGEVDSLLPADGAFLLDILLQGDAVDKLHDDVLDLVAKADIVHLDNVGVVEPRDGLGLIAETAQEIAVVGKFFLQNLDGHPAALHAVVGLVDIGHAAHADKLVDFVPAIQALADESIHKQLPTFL